MSGVFFGMRAGYGLTVFVMVVISLLSGGLFESGRAAPPTAAGCRVFPADNVWNVPADRLPTHPKSDVWVKTIGAAKTLIPDFGAGHWPPDSGAPIGIPWIAVRSGQKKVRVDFQYADESDPGPYPVPSNPPIEGGPKSDGDRHVIMLDRDRCKLYELYHAYPRPDGSWKAGSGAIFDLKSNRLRPDGWTSADAAGLPILPGLIRYDEVKRGRIDHAIRFTTDKTRKAYVWPARHFASSLTAKKYPPMGQRFRLRADYDISGFPKQARIVLKALKIYGMILADNGSPWFISGEPHPEWDNDDLRALRRVRGSDFEAVDSTPLMIDPDSAKAKTSR